MLPSRPLTNRALEESFTQWLKLVSSGPPGTIDLRLWFFTGPLEGRSLT